MPRTQPFDDHLDEYEEWFDKHPFVYLSELDAVRHFVPKNKKGLEIGIGTGRFAIPLGISEGVEPSRAMREFAREKGLVVHNGVGEALQFPDQTFDFALMVTTVCFFDDILAAFSEAARILKPAGRLIIGFVDKNSALGKVYDKNKENNKFYRPATFYSTEEICTYLDMAGFGTTRIVQTVFGNLDSVARIQPFKTGYGEGGFVVLAATKQAES